MPSLYLYYIIKYLPALRALSSKGNPSGAGTVVTVRRSDVKIDLQNNIIFTDTLFCQHFCTHHRFCIIIKRTKEMKGGDGI